MKLVLLVNYNTVNTFIKTLPIVTCCIILHFCLCFCVCFCLCSCGVGFVVHQGSVLRPLLFLLVLEALSHQFCTSVPWEALNADDRAVMADSLEECIARVKDMERGYTAQETESQHEGDEVHGLKTWDRPFSVTLVRFPV